jgi:hypothetical protein
MARHIQPKRRIRCPSCRRLMTLVDAGRFGEPGKPDPTRWMGHCEHCGMDWAGPKPDVLQRQEGG